MSHRLAELHRSGPPKLLNRATSAREWTDHRADITRRWIDLIGGIPDDEMGSRRRHERRSNLAL